MTDNLIVVTIKISFDPAKSARNEELRDLPFEKARDFDWRGAIFEEDQRKDYGEKRIIGTGYLEDRIHVICFTCSEDSVRIISFRKANKKEVKAYEKKKASFDQ